VAMVGVLGMLLPRPASRDCGDGSAVAGAGWGFVSDLGHLIPVRARRRPTCVVAWPLVAVRLVGVLVGMVGVALAIAAGRWRLGAGVHPSLGERKTGERSQERDGNGNGGRALPTMTSQPILH